MKSLIIWLIVLLVSGLLIGIDIKGNTSEGRLNFTYGNWKAQLCRMSEEKNKSVFRFEFSEWKTHNGMPEYGLQMNRLATAIEKMFASFDENVQINTYERDLSKHLTLF